MESGVINLIKPPGITSFQAVKAVRSILGEKRVGHCGTLDPMASGVLLVVFGAATRLSGSLMSGEKTYRGEIIFGVRTDSGDLTGKVLEEVPVPPLDPARLKAVFQTFVGEISQVPPMVSALKYGGRRLYQLAREGVTVPRAARRVTIRSFELLGIDGPRAGFRVACSKGTYVRTLAEDAGRALGLPAALASLVRERSGTFEIGAGLPWEALVGMDRQALLRHAAVRPEPPPR
ncbi:MAG: tRNA pseudouridine(55) synthase TruB [Elusimicrobia bacterium RIFCSPLOWO2_01_FULL_64_13]|nr:MAG: tRNA pseudouridine(55) synthase TruB [Elusimicrobia bacterium RIFCSPLOWO2_01_FULL_64_13]